MSTNINKSTWTVREFSHHIQYYFVCVCVCECVSVCFFTPIVQRRSHQLKNCIPKFLQSERRYSELTLYLNVETPLFSSVASFNHVLHALCNAHFQGMCHLRKLSRSEVSLNFPRLVVENGFVPYMRNSDFLEIQCSNKGHFKFLTSSKAVAKKFILSEQYLNVHADPTKRVYYLRSEKLFNSVCKVSCGFPSNAQLVRNPRDPKIDATSLKILAKNELKESVPANLNRISKDCLAGVIEAHRMRSTWLGFSTLYQTLVSHANRVCVEIKPQHGNPGQSTVKFEATVRKTTVTWGTAGRSIRIIYGPGVVRCRHCSCKKLAQYGNNEPDHRGIPTHCHDHKSWKDKRSFSFFHDHF